MSKDSEIAETFRALKAFRKDEKSARSTYLMTVLKNSGLKYKMLSISNHHVRLANFDLWLTSDKWINRSTGARSRGVERLIKEMQDDR